MAADWSPGQQFDFLPKSELGPMIDALRQAGYTVLGPVLAEGVVSFHPVDSVSDLARGLRDEQGPGQYRVKDGDQDLYFQYVVGPDGPEALLLPTVATRCSSCTWKGPVRLGRGPRERPSWRSWASAVRAGGHSPSRTAFSGLGDPRRCACESEPYYTQVRREAC